MSNVIIVGFKKSEAETLRDRIDAIMKANGWDGDSATVIMDAETRWCNKKEPAPYLVVQHSQAHMAEAIGRTLYCVLNLDIQIEVTHKYIASAT